ncbi:MAG: hypothetical protein KAT70_08725, partial [Thermoplasmata archaeon]|nr:hypothetical protein [Thermoplasmata archaeon]
MFLPEARLKDTIIDILREEERSISGIQRALKQKGIELHKLVLTGYLRSLADLGILKEREIPPSKVYSTTATYTQDIYSAVGDAVRRNVESPAERAPTVLYILQRLLLRPIFLYELKKAGVEEPYNATNIEGDKRMDARRVLAKTGIKIPHKDPAYLLDEKEMKDIYTRVQIAALEDIVLESTTSLRL